MKIPYEGFTPKWLFVCNCGCLRSATAAHVAYKHYNYNTRCCGVEPYALVPLTQALCSWADYIVFFGHETHKIAQYQFDFTSHFILDIPNCYVYNDQKLQQLILTELATLAQGKEQ